MNITCLRGNVFGFLPTIVWLHLVGMKRSLLFLQWSWECFPSKKWEWPSWQVWVQMCGKQPGLMSEGLLSNQGTRFHPLDLLLPCCLTLASLVLTASFSPMATRKQVSNFLWDLLMRKQTKAGKCYHLEMKCHAPSECSTSLVLLRLHVVSLYQKFPQ